MIESSDVIGLNFTNQNPPLSCYLLLLYYFKLPYTKKVFIITHTDQV